MDQNKLSIGTAQLGSNYGIAFTAEKITSEEFGNIMAAARNNGIASLDTAIGYGDSQSILGDIGVKSWSITTKLPPIPSNINKIDILTLDGNTDFLDIPDTMNKMLSDIKNFIENKIPKKNVEFDVSVHIC